MSSQPHETESADGLPTARPDTGSVEFSLEDSAVIAAAARRGNPVGSSSSDMSGSAAGTVISPTRPRGGSSSAPAGRITAGPGAGSGTDAGTGEPRFSLEEGTAVVPPPRDEWGSSLVGGNIGKYRVLRLLGRGAMGVVFEAHDPLIDRRVALKLLTPDTLREENAVRRFLAEAKAAARVHHPNVVSVFDVGMHEGSYFLVLELVTGGSAADWIKEGPLSWREACQVAADVCKGLSAAHAAGLIHRDIKPANIMRAADGTVKLTDFGLAKMQGRGGSESLTGSGAVVGTPHYMSPEQCRSEPPGPAADLYSVGATLAALLTGRPPFHGASGVVNLMFAHCHTDVPDLRLLVPTIPDPVQAVVARAMAKTADARFASAEDMRQELARLLEGDGSAVSTLSELSAGRMPMLHKAASAGTVFGMSVTSSTQVGQATARMPAHRQPAADHAGAHSHAGPPHAGSARRLDAPSTHGRTARRGLSPVVIGVAAGAVVLVAIVWLLVLPGRKPSDKVRAPDQAAVADEPGDEPPDSPDDPGKTVKPPDSEPVVKTKPADPKPAPTARRLPGTAAASLTSEIALFDRPVRVLCWSRDGNWMTAGSDDGTIIAVDTSGKTPVRKTVRTGAHRSPVAGVAIDAKSTRTASAGTDGTIRIWSMPDLLEESIFDSGHVGGVTRLVQFDHDGFFTTIGRDSAFRWNRWQATKAGGDGRPYTGAADCAALTSSRFVIGLVDGHVHLGEFAMGGIEFAASTTAIRQVAMSSDHGVLHTADAAGVVRRWETNTAMPVRNWKEAGFLPGFQDLGRWPEGVSAMAILPGDDALVIAIGLRIEVFGIRSPVSRGHFELPAAVTSLAVPPEGDRLAVGCADGVLRFVDVSAIRGPTGLMRTMFAHLGAVTVIEAMPGDYGQIITGSADGTLRAWQPGALYSYTYWPRMHPGGVVGAWSSTNNRVLTAGAEGTVRILDTTADKPPTLLPEVDGGKPLVALAGDASGRRFALAAESGLISVFELAPAENAPPAIRPVRTIRPTAAANRIAAFSGSDTCWVIANVEGFSTTGLWESDGEGLRKSGWSSAVADVSPYTAARRWSEERRGTLIGDKAGNVHLYPPANPKGGNRKTHVIETLGSPVTAFAVRHDRTLAAAASAEGKIIVFTLPSGKVVARFRDDKSVTALGFARKAEVLVSGGQDGVLRVWDVRSLERDPGTAPPPAGPDTMD